MSSNVLLLYIITGSLIQMHILPLWVLLPLKFNILEVRNPGNLLSTLCWLQTELPQCEHQPEDREIEPKSSL